MVIPRLILMALLSFNIAITARDLALCDMTSNCDDGEACVSYTSCNTQKERQQVRRCLKRSCYSKGYNCPNSVYCQNQHCGDLRCH